MAPSLSVDIYHNILWSKYKGVVFSKLYNYSSDKNINFNFFQIAATESARVGINNVDLRYHAYPYSLLYNECYEKVPKIHLYINLFKRVLNSKSSLILIAGYHLPEYWLMLLACIVSKKKRGVFCDSTYYDRPKSLFKNILKYIYFSLCNGFFGYGSRSREYLMHYHVNPKNIYTRCQAAALPINYNKNDAYNFRVVSMLKSQHPRILYVGRFSEEKGIDTLIDAFNIFRQTYNNALLILAGAGQLLDSIKQKVGELGISHLVIFTGSMDINMLAEEYLKATCLVLPSKSEPWGLVVNEALSYGCPVIVSDRCGCVPELVIDDVSGYRFPAGDVNDLSNKLVLLCRNFSDHRKVAEKCLSIISHYTPENAAKQIYDGCEIILGQPKL